MLHLMGLRQSRLQRPCSLASILADRVFTETIFSEPEGSFLIRFGGSRQRILILSSTAILAALLLAIVLLPEMLAGAVSAVTTGTVDPLSYNMAARGRAPPRPMGGLALA